MLVPLNDRELVIDLMTVLGLPVVIAARSGLGTINHTLLTIEALRARALPIAGVVMVGAPNVRTIAIAIETHGRVIGHRRTADARAAHSGGASGGGRRACARRSCSTSLFS